MTAVVACKRCGQSIRWLRTTAGKMMPVDAEPNDAGNVYLRDGLAHVLHKDETPPGDVVLLYPHFGSCGH